VGAPDESERADLVAEFLPAGNPEEVASHTAGFTPADFALVAQRSAQLAFDRALAGGPPEILSADVLAAVELTRPSVSLEASLRFEEEAATYSRL
jgi:SpoVK/Ycf46/Vps4 family AAA+-type ATPase